MSTPRDRWGVFLVPSRFETELQREANRVEATMIGKYGELGPPAWYEARHALFEKLLARAAYHRVSESPKAVESVAQLVDAINGRKRGTWGTATPAQRRELARKHAAKIADPVLRSAVEDVVSRVAPHDAGLWIETETSIPEMHTEDADQADDDREPGNYEEAAARLEALVAEGDRDEQLESSYRASLCELTDADARHAAAAWKDVDDDDLDATARANQEAAGRIRLDAILREEERTASVIEGIEHLCERAPIASLARNIYTGAQARELLVWLEKQRRTLARDRVLAVLRRAVENQHGFAIVFDTL